MINERLDSRMNRILWVSSCAPSKKAKEAGGQTFHYYYKGLLEDGRFDIKLISLGDIKWREELEKEFRSFDVHFIYSERNFLSKIKKINNLESMLNPWNKYAGLISNFCASEILKLAKDYKNNGFNPDIIIFEWTNTVVLAEQMSHIFPNSKIVASEHDVTFVGYERKWNYYRGISRQLWKIRYLHEKRVELQALETCSLVLPHNTDNKKILIAEGIEDSRILGLVPFYNDMRKCHRNSNQKDILYFGAMARTENVLSVLWFIDNVMPLLAGLDIRLVVLGSNPPEKLKELESDRIHITGFVDSIEPYFQQSMCFVAPLVLGAGIKVKILEAMSSGIPVLTNHIGIEGIPAQNGKDYFYCILPEEYAMTIGKLYRNEIDTKMLEKEAKKLLGESFSMEESLKNYKNKLIEIGTK